ncbi:MAG TPA: porin family protein [Segetibacter sp.]|jgi:hypothetical protein
MKKMFLLAAATVIASVSFSQVRFGAQIIGNAGKTSFETPDEVSFKNSTKIGFGAGFVSEIPVSESVSIRSSLNYLQKKSGAEFEVPLIPGKKHVINNTLNYLELPVNLVYNLNGESANIYFGAGPSLGYALSGKSKYKGWDFDDNNNVVAVEETTDVFKKDETGAAFKRFDLSANFNAGVQFKNGLFVNGGYLLGLTNLGSNDDGSYKNRGILLTVGFLLPSNK